ncbi:hypothetical protein [Aureibaculum luteum]|uniref:hypothetical protein n=1 Tax=Aureibaculum luteum TaxID=1548456 RepID=UPI0013006E35|nr:hypothetical protein [Aureibaculum luteum]
MTLSEVYFYLIILIFLLFSLLIVTFSEDIKENKYYNRYFKITFGIGFIGAIMEILNWNYFCKFNCILITFSPFLTLLITKGIIKFYKEVFKREAFQMHRGELSDGIWVKNQGDVKNKWYNGWYTVNIFSFPFFIITTIFFIFEKNVC